MSEEAEKYFKKEWQMFADNPEREAFLLDITKDINIKRVLDVGCGAGQQMLPFLQKHNAFCYGIDVSADAISVARRLYSKNDNFDKAFFLSAKGEEIPFADETFDVVICRVALSFMDNKKAFREITRVLRPNGKLLLKIQTSYFYLETIRDRIKLKNLRMFYYPVIALFSGTWFWLSGNQLKKNILPGKETFLTLSGLQRELSNNGLKIEAKLSDSTKSAPSFSIIKNTGGFRHL